MCKPIRKRRINSNHGPPEFHDSVPERPYTEWDDPLGDYNPYALYEHPYNLKPESLSLGSGDDKEEEVRNNLLQTFVKYIQKF